MDIKTIENIIHKDKNLRLELFSSSFWHFARYYYKSSWVYPYAHYHKKYAQAMQDNKSIVFVGHREACKTQRAIWYVVRAIVHQKHKNIARANSIKSKAEETLHIIREQLQTNEKLINDYGDLFFSSEEERQKENQRTRKSKKKNTVSHFMTKTGVSVQAHAITTSIRGMVHNDNNVLLRPSLYVADDLDTKDTIKSRKMIEHRYQKFKSETLGAMGSNSQKILLGNVIGVDGIMPRLVKDYKNIYSFFRVPSILPDDNTCYVDGEITGRKGDIMRDRFVHTKQEAQEKNKEYKDAPFLPFVSFESLKEEQGATGFGQNHYLIPYKEGDNIITIDKVTFQECDIDKDYTTVIAIDAAFSERETSDELGISAIRYSRISGRTKKHVIYEGGISGQDKDQSKSINIIENIYKTLEADIVLFEMNNGGGILKSLLSQRGIPTTGKHTKKDKVQRLLKLQAQIENRIVTFDNSIRNSKMITQLIEFPNAMNDDRMDAFMLALEYTDNASQRKQIREIDLSTKQSFNKYRI